MKRQIITTNDGSHTVEIPDMQVTYHSHHGALRESVHVFIEAGLRWYAGQATAAGTTTSGSLQSGQTSKPKSLSIFEMGFGTGLNAYLTALEAEQRKTNIYYTAVEQYPLTPEETASLNYATNEKEKELFNLLHQSHWQTDARITGSFVLNKQQISLLDFHPQQSADIIYFDAFAPRAQPELWTEAVFKKMYNLLNPGGVLVTYCSKSVVRRAMQAAGFIVTKIPGPQGKREMVRAEKRGPS